MIRNVQFQDLNKLEQWCPKEYPPPDLSSGLYCSQLALLGNRGNLEGFALLKLICEAVLIIDPSVSNLEKARLVKNSFDGLTKEALENYGLDQVQFVLREDQVHYAKILKKHFGFKDQPGIPLILWR